MLRTLLTAGAVLVAAEADASPNVPKKPTGLQHTTERTTEEDSGKKSVEELICPEEYNQIQRIGQEIVNLQAKLIATRMEISNLLDGVPDLQGKSPADVNQRITDVFTQEVEQNLENLPTIQTPDGETVLLQCPLQVYVRVQQQQHDIEGEVHALLEKLYQTEVQSHELEQTLQKRVVQLLELQQRIRTKVDNMFRGMPTTPKRRELPTKEKPPQAPIQGPVNV